VNRALTRISLACLVMFVLLLINVNYVQGFETTSLANDPQNSRISTQQFQYKRGPIIAAGDGSNTTIASSRLVKGSSGTYKRFYADGPVYAPVTGYDSIFSATGVEGAEDKLLAGTDPRLEVHNFISLITGKSKQGASVSLTISPRAQQAAYAALKASGHSGALVAIDPSTGAILAMASYPSFDPNGYATLSSASLDKFDKRLRLDKAQPLLNRAINQTYPPGSTFKIVTSSAAFSTHRLTDQNSPVFAPPSLTLPNGNHLINDQNEVCGSGRPPVIQAFYLSCNTAFGNLGIKLGGSTLQRQANSYGFNAGLTKVSGAMPELKVPMPVSPSVLPNVSDGSLRAFTAIGQFNDQVTPLQEAMLAATVANGGTLMTPYLVQQVQAPDESRIESASPAPLSHPISPTVAGYLTKMMEQVTQNPAGTAYQTANPNVAGVVIAGKTGTAQNGIPVTNLDDAVFTCFAPASSPRIAVGVIVKGGGFGAQAAAPIAVKVIQAYLKVK
jgi:peptidoglycan glycosyltransferase